MKKTAFLAMLVLILWTAMASASTVDLLPLFDTNNDGKAQFGDGFSSKEGLDFDEQEVITQFFNLAPTPASTGSFCLTLTFDNVQTNAYFNLNGTDYAPLGHGYGTKTYTGDVSELLGTGNSLTFFVYALSGSNLDDYSLSLLSLKYDEAVTGGSPVPEPGTLTLFGLGMLGLAGVGRKKIIAG